MPKQVVLASGNRHKLREVRTILEPIGIRVLGADDVGGLPEVIEDGHTFSENAVKKARAAACATGLACVADDSGLVVRALNGRPGIHSSRYAGPNATDRENVEKLLGELDAVVDRQAKFVCVLALALPESTKVRTASGEVHGTILRECRGRSGFGYDPVFQPIGRDESFAELGEDEKNRISHRAEALRNALSAGFFSCIPDTPQLD